MKEGCGTAYRGKFFRLDYQPLTSVFSLTCDGVRLQIYTNGEFYWNDEWHIDVKFKNYIFDKSTPFDERLKRAITEGTEKVMQLDEFRQKENDCEKRCASKIDKSIKGVLNDD